MQQSVLLNQFDIEKWKDYKPLDPQYAKYFEENPNFILAGLKIADVYVQFKNARKSMEYIYLDDYGQLVEKNNEDSLLMIKAKFLFDALALYNYCVDLSMQFLYLYADKVSKEVIFNENYYIKQIKECKYYKLKERLTNKKKESLLDKLDDFRSTPLIKEINDAYNYIKHRGTYHIDGADDYHDGFATMGIDEKTVHFIKRRVINIKSFSKKLQSFDEQFIVYFNDLIEDTMPKDFCEKRVSLIKLYDFLLSYDEFC